MQKKQEEHDKNMRLIYQKTKTIRQNETHKKLTAKEQSSLER